MSNVFVDKTKIDNLANAISVKSGESVPMTLTEMTQAVDGIDTSGGGITPSGNIDITQAGVTDVTNYATATAPSAVLDVGVGMGEFYTDSGVRRWRYRGYVSTEVGDGGSAGWIAEDVYYSPYFSKNAVAKNTTVTPTTSSQTIGGANYMMEGAVTVSAMPTGTAGTPTATKGAVSNHSVSVTPSVTNTTGYITGSTKTGTAVTVSASELVSGTYTVDSSGTKDVTNYASASVPAGTAGTPSASKGTVSNHSVSVTPSVTNTTGWITGSTKTGTAVTVSASELVSGTLSVTQNGTADVTNYASVDVSVSGGGSSKNVQVMQSTTRTSSGSLTKVLGDMTVSKTGTYDIYWSGGRSNTSTGYTWGTRLYVDGSGYGTENTSWTNNCQSNHLSNVSLTANQKLSVYARGRTGSYYTFVPMLVIVEV